MMTTTTTLPLLRDCETTTIHARTRTELLDGTLPAGTLVIDPSAALRRIDEFGLDQVTVRTRDAQGRIWIERFFARDFVRAIADWLSTSDAPPTVEPVTTRGVYELTDGTVAEIVWDAGRLRVSRRVPAAQRCLLRSPR